jgi:hypothetical protein
MTSPCIDCPIVRSCQYKRENPQECNHKPAVVWPKKPGKPDAATQYFVSESLNRYARQEQMVRMSAIESGEF